MKTDKIRNIFVKILRTLQNIEMLPKILYTAWKVYILKDRVVKQAAIAITYDCLCQCKFCSAQNLKESNRQTLSTEDFEVLIDSFARLGTLSICFTGGETLMHKDLTRLVKHVRSRNMLCSIITSCVSYSDALWEELKTAGINTFYISVDGIGDRHDTFRGVPGLFKKVETAIRRCRELDIEFFFNGVVTNDNIRDGSIYEIIEYCQKENIYFMILHTSATGKYSDPKHLLTQENLLEFDRIRKMDNVFWEGDANLNKVGCPAGIEVVFVTAYGEILPCPFIEVSFGNVKESRLEDIVNKMWSYDLFGKITPVCLMGADRRFYDDWLAPLDPKNLPAPIDEHPVQKTLGNRKNL